MIHAHFIKIIKPERVFCSGVFLASTRTPVDALYQLYIESNGFNLLPVRESILLGVQFCEHCECMESLVPFRRRLFCLLNYWSLPGFTFRELTHPEASVFGWFSLTPSISAQTQLDFHF